MVLPNGFVFSQSSLQDYRDCARRFQLRYLQHRRWPAPETKDELEFELHMQRGHAFHRLMRQWHLGVPLSPLERTVAEDPDLSRWLRNCVGAPPEGLPEKVREPEWMLSVSVAGYRLEARYDLLAGAPGQRWVIVDWKTSRRRSTRSWLGKRMQTRIYPFVLVLGGATLNAKRPIAPEQVQMWYWFAEFPAQPELFAYDAERFAADQALLAGMIEEIKACPEEGFQKTEDRLLCRYCVYRSLCWDDVQAGLLAGVEELEAAEEGLEDIDLESIAPIPF
jgi:predicted RecB family nuclease